MTRLLAIAAVLALVACAKHDRPAPHPDPERQRRVIEPPSGRVRPLPPHAIRADGVGPYRLGATLADLLGQLPSGPGIATIEIPGVAHRSILRAEDGAILIGGDPLGKATFVAVVGSEVARTESGIHVGSLRADLARELGGPVEDPDTARDPRLVVPTGMRNARFVVESGRIAAIVVTAEDAASPPPDVPPAGSGSADPDGDGEDLLGRDDADKLLQRIPGLVFAAPLRDPDGHHELVAVARSDDADARTWTLRVFRIENGKLAPTIEPAQLYQLSATSARWIGADLRDLDLYLELHARADAIEVGGLLTTRVADKLRDVVVISPTVVSLRRPAAP